MSSAPTPAQHPLRALARTWWLAPLVLVASLLTSYLLTRAEEPRYRASTSVVVIPNGATVEAVRDMIDGLANLDRRNVVATLARVSHSSDVVARAAAQVGVDEQTLRRFDVRSIVLPNTNIIELEVSGPDPETCATLANEVASVGASETTNLYRIYRLKVLEPASAPRRPASPDVRRNLVVAGVLGLVGGVLVAAAAEWVLRAFRPLPA